jgi:hypothetical protein
MIASLNKQWMGRDLLELEQIGEIYDPNNSLAPSIAPVSKG